MRIFIAGATGVIGRRAVPLLLQPAHRTPLEGFEAIIEARRDGACA